MRMRLVRRPRKRFTFARFLNPHGIGIVSISAFMAKKALNTKFRSLKVDVKRTHTHAFAQVTSRLCRLTDSFKMNKSRKRSSDGAGRTVKIIHCCLCASVDLFSFYFGSVPCSVSHNDIHRVVSRAPHWHTERRKGRTINIKTNLR